MIVADGAMPRVFRCVTCRGVRGRPVTAIGMLFGCETLAFVCEPCAVTWMDECDREDQRKRWTR